MAGLTGAQVAKATNYWNAYLNDVERCHFPKYDSEVRDGEEKSLFLDVDVQCLEELQQRAAKDPAFLPSMLRAAWSILLHCYTGLDEVCFGYGEVAGDSQIPLGVAISALADAKLTRHKLDGELALKVVVEHAKKDYQDGETYGRAAIDNALVKSLHASKKNLCNTAMLMWKASGTRSLGTGTGVLSQSTTVGDVSGVSVENCSATICL
ncbi:MAG: hypothetical protein LQ340_000880 [Diploschistes diacapsis]|nr:MAG: hypothetical protein LQ340_000880 [Diploschistes diacapsis]